MTTTQQAILFLQVSEFKAKEKEMQRILSLNSYPYR